jgi:restriction system protein
MTDIPRFDQMMNPLLQALRNLGRTATSDEMLREIAEVMDLTPEQLAVLHAPGKSSKSEVGYRLAWTCTYLRKYGLVENVSRGQWRLTDEGESTGEVDPSAVKRAVRRMDGQVGARDEPERVEEEVELSPGTGEADSSGTRSLTPSMPVYKDARLFLRIMDGVPYTLYRRTYNQIIDHRGSPQEQVDWRNPDVWIPHLLSDDEAKLALRLWKESGYALNPRHLRGSWYLTTKHELLRENEEGVLHVTERGREFLEDANSGTVAEIDAFEGILTVLRLVAERGPGKRGDFLSEYGEFCRAHTRFQSDRSIRGSLYERLTNLIAREFVTRNGQVYEISEPGLAYLERNARLVLGRPEPAVDKRGQLRRLALEIREEARQQLAAYLEEMDPYKFEQLVKFLLEEMGYRDVETTSPVNDKGVDVVAEIDLGISSVREVVQVKRRRGNVGRRVLDELRGSLHRFNAVRGTIVTTGGFSRGTQAAAFERGAAPITLIDGDKLLALLIEHDIGVTRQVVDYLEFDASKLEQFEVQEGSGQETSSPTY